MDVITKGGCNQITVHSANHKKIRPGGRTDVPAVFCIRDKKDRKAMKYFFEAFFVKNY